MKKKNKKGQIKKANNAIENDALQTIQTDTSAFIESYTDKINTHENTHRTYRETERNLQDRSKEREMISFLSQNHNNSDSYRYKVVACDLWKQSRN